MMSLFRKALFLCLLSLNLGYAADKPEEAVHIDSIETVKGQKAFDFSTYINFTVNKSLSTSWAFGFYMPRTFNQLVTAQQDVNPKLKLQICELGKVRHCAPLKLVVKSKNTAVVLPSYYSAGYTSVFTLKNPQDSFPLLAGSTYQIELLDNNQWPPMNYSAMPQNLFLVDHYAQANALFYPLSSKADNYKIGGYKQSEIDNEMIAHQQQMLDHAMALKHDFSEKYGLVPSPVSVSVKKETFYPLENNTFNIAIAFDRQAEKAIEQKLKLFETMTDRLGLALKFNKTTPQYANIVIRPVALKALDNNPEGYLLEINGDGVTIKAANSTGVFYALVTLSQILYHVNQNNSDQKSKYLLLPELSIKDYPRFQYRGVLLDTARHFFTVEEIKHLLDAMAVQKLNTLHFHVADDEGFRLALDALTPEVQDLAATRGYINELITPPQMFGQANLDKTNFTDYNPDNGQMLIKNYPRANTAYHGLYSKADIKSLIAYANARGITIIPEIDLPGHARALIQADPSIFDSDQGKFISVQGYYDDVIPVCLYNEAGKKAQRFTQKIKQIVQEIAMLFSRQSTLYAQNEVSVGGDEVAAGAWQGVNDCDNKQWKSKPEAALAKLSDKQKSGFSLALIRSQLFFKKLSQNLEKIKLSGWQQAIQGDDPAGTILPDFVVKPESFSHAWVWNASTNGGMSQAINLAKNNYPTVLAYADKTYFDLAYSPDKWEPGFSWATRFSDTFSALQIAQATTETIRFAGDKGQNIVGVEGALWSENLYNFRHLSYMALPKMTGLAEAGWSDASTTSDGDKLNWLSLKMRLGDSQSGFLNYLEKISTMTPNYESLFNRLDTTIGSGD
ncbi:MAG: family 20 glycosylhydrolase [Francisellaceae bacterium]